MSEVPTLVDHLFRRSAGQMVATLARVFGAAQIELAEEVVQEALLSALAQWPFAGIPEKPAAWLFQVARNRALDRLRRDARFRDKEEEVAEAFARRRDPGGAMFEDDDLQMMLLACDERIAPDARLVLTLKTICGFSVAEIARALLAQPATIAQRLVRVRRFIRENGIEFEPPSRFELPRRLDSVLDAIYLMFNEGYSAHAGDDLIRADLVAEAIRLAEELCVHRDTALPKTHALAALLHFQAARIPARIDGAGDLLLLDAQDRALWDRTAIERGVEHFNRAIRGETVSRFHIEAAIAATHAVAPSFEETDWPRIVALYDDLMSVAPSPVVALNRAVALAMIDGPAAALPTALPLPLDGYLPYHAAVGELAARAGDAPLAREHFTRAAALAGTGAERRFFERKLQPAEGS